MGNYDEQTKQRLWDFLREKFKVSVNKITTKKDLVKQINKKQYKQDKLLKQQNKMVAFFEKNENWSFAKQRIKEQAEKPIYVRGYKTKSGKLVKGSSQKRIVWLPKDNKRLLKLNSKGYSKSYIAFKMHRSSSSVTNRLRRLKK